MNNSLFILDACSVINLLNINDDHLTRRINSLKFYISEEVYNEIQLNVYKRIEREKVNKTISETDYKELRSKLDSLVNKLRQNVIWNYEIENNWSHDLRKEVKKHIKYSEDDGELCSLVLSLFLSRFEKIIDPIDKSTKYGFDNKRVTFNTDDLPAKELFESFFKEVQIGSIEDTIDLIILLFRSDSTFSKSDLRNILSELHSQYLRELKLFENSLRTFLEGRTSSLKKEKSLLRTLNSLLLKIEKLEFAGINEIREGLKRERKYSLVSSLIKRHSSLFDLEYAANGKYLSKIRYSIKRIDIIEKYRIA